MKTPCWKSELMSLKRRTIVCIYLRDIGRSNDESSGSILLKYLLAVVKNSVGAMRKLGLTRKLVVVMVGLPARGKT
jgi:hypothetical protein